MAMFPSRQEFLFPQEVAPFKGIDMSWHTKKLFRRGKTGRTCFPVGGWVGWNVRTRFDLDCLTIWALQAIPTCWRGTAAFLRRFPTVLGHQGMFNYFGFRKFEWWGFIISENIFIFFLETLEVWCLFSLSLHLLLRCKIVIKLFPWFLWQLFTLLAFT